MSIKKNDKIAYDNRVDTKRAMDIVRNKKRPKFVNEQSGGGKDVFEKVRESDSKEYSLPTPEETVEEEREFQNSVSKFVEFDDIKMYDQHVEWSGYLNHFDIRWFMTTNDYNGLYVTAHLLGVNEEVLEVLTKLETFYSSWRDSWIDKL